MDNTKIINIVYMTYEYYQFKTMNLKNCKYENDCYDITNDQANDALNIIWIPIILRGLIIIITPFVIRGL